VITQSHASRDLILERVPDLAAARGVWTRLARQTENVYGSWEWANAWHRTLGEGTELAVAIARTHAGDAVALIPLYVARERPLRLVRFIGAPTADELGPLCAPEDRRFAVAAMRQHICEVLGGAGMFVGERLHGRRGVGFQLGATTLRRAASPVLSIAGRSFDEYLASRSRNFREQVRRRERKLARAHRLVYRLTGDASDVEPDMRTLIRLHQARWRHGRSQAFSGPRASFHIEFAKSAFEQGWLRLWTLELDGLPVAAWYGLRYAGIEWYYQSGRDPAFQKMNVGFVLLCHTIRCAFEDGMREYRFGLGGEEYKTRFSDFDPGLETVAVTTGVRGRLALAALRTGLDMRDRVCKARPRT
jgi:CelD/BcsL family acetyltransferase involved in cellulose biosynthesis